MTIVAARVARSVRTICITGLETLEARLAEGLLAEWTALIECDPRASLFQSPGWCLPWYRCYADAYQPFVVTVRDGGELAGLVPMAVEKASGRLVFASDSMADYRDIVARPRDRHTVVEELLRAYLAGNFPNPLEVGWLDPTSDTRSILERVCAARGLPYIVRTQPCYRWFPPPPKKPSAQKFLNWYRRQGEVSFEVVETEEAWRRFRDEYYRQHSLRQVQTGRDRAFDDPVRRAFYDALFQSSEFQTHVTAFTAQGRMLAGHFGYVWRNVLLLGPPSIRLEDELRSPAVILLAWIIQNAASLGLQGFDMTIGESDFKKRLANHCVELTAVDIHNRRTTYLRQRARAAVMNGLKAAVARAAGPDAWNRTLKPACERLAYKLARMREDGIIRTIGAGAAALPAAVYERRVGHVYAVTPEAVRPAEARLDPGDAFDVHDNCVEDLLQWHGSSLTTRSAITVVARTFARARSANHTLHTVVLNGRLAGWGYSYYPSGPAQLTETPGAMLEFGPGAVSLYDFHVVPEFRGRRIYQALLTRILRQRFAEGASRAYITVIAANAASRVAIERVGFQVVARNLYRRVLHRSSLKPLPVS